MNKKITSLFTILFLFSVCGCNNDVSSSISSSIVDKPKNELEISLSKLKDNNFSIDYYDSYVNNNNIERNSKFYYTNYSFQGEGDFGFVGVAQGEDLIFRYTLDNNEVIPGLPLINYNNGTRYQSIFDYQESYGMNNFDYDNLSVEKNSDGSYTYNFGENIPNDRLILPIFLRFTPNSIPPKELKIKVVKDIITFEATILSYDLDNDGIDEAKDTVKAIIYDIGKTENKEIKEYLTSGKTSRTPLDLNFYQFFHPYMFSSNYTIDLDATKMKNNNGYYYTYKATERYLDDAMISQVENSTVGYMMNQGYLNRYTIENNKIKLLGTTTDQDGNFLTSLYGEFMSYCMRSLSYDLLIGYIDENKDNIYYLTDSQLIYILSYICNNEIYEENYCDKVKLEIINKDTHEFKLYFDMYNKKTKRDLGTYQAHFYNLNTTEIKEVSEYYSLGNNPKNQTKDNLNNILQLLNTHNYSMDAMTSGGMTKFYNTPNYFYMEVYGNPNNNTGFIKENDSIYKFSIYNNVIKVDKAIDYASGENGLEMVSIGEHYADSNDFGFISVISEEIYNLDNYSLANIHNQDYWKINELPTANKILNYYMPYDNIKSTGVGIIFNDDINNSKITFLSSFISNDGNIEGYVTYTYYDLNKTSHPVIENYLNSLGGN